MGTSVLASPRFLGYLRIFKISNNVSSFLRNFLVIYKYINLTNIYQFRCQLNKSVGKLLVNV